MRTVPFLTILVVILLLVNAVTITVLWMGRSPQQAILGGPPMHPPHMSTHGHRGPSVETLLQDVVGFDASQMSSFRELRETHHDQVLDIVPKLRKAKETYITTQNDLCSEEALIAEIAAQHIALDKITRAHVRDLRALCTDEQITAFDLKKKEIASIIIGPPPPPNGRPRP